MMRREIAIKNTGMCTDGTAEELYYCIRDGKQRALFEMPGIETESLIASLKTKKYHETEKTRDGYFHIRSRRYLGNKYKLVDFIKSIVFSKCAEPESFCDIFAGTGTVGGSFNDGRMKIISNDILFSNYVCLRSFLSVDDEKISDAVSRKIKHLNGIPADSENYFSEHFGGTYFSGENARKIGAVREEIEHISESDDERNILLCSLLYAADRAANTVGHYDAFRKKMDTVRSVHLLKPEIAYGNNSDNEVYRKDANELVKEISCDVLYIDPPYNSRQYSDAYHLPENLTEWKKPAVFGISRKMDRSHIKSEYCLKSAASAFADLINHADCSHILLSYNNTGDLKDGRSNARMSDGDIVSILEKKGSVEIFEKRYRAFTTGKSSGEDNAERVFYCKVRK